MLGCFRFCTFGFEAMPHSRCYFTSIVDKTHHEPGIALFFFFATSAAFLATPEVF